MSGVSFGPVPIGSVLPIPFSTYGKTNGESLTMTGLAVTDIEVYKGTSMTQRASDAGYALMDTDGIDIDGLTGIHGFSIDTGDNTDSGFYAAGSFYTVIVSSITVDGQAVNFVAATFRLTAAENVTGVPVMDVSHISGDSGAANALEAVFDGTGADVKFARLAITGGVQITQSNANEAGIVVTGNGTGSGIAANGGANGQGATFTGGATSGVGLGVYGQTGGGLEIEGGADYGVQIIGIGGPGMSIDSQAAEGIIVQADTGFAGIRIFGGNGEAALRLTGTGTGAGLAVTGGSTGAGIDINGGSTSGAGVTIDSTTGDALTVTSGGGNGDAISLTPNGTGHGINGTLSGVVDLQSGLILGAAATGTLSTTQATTNLTGYADNQLIGRYVYWLSGAAEGEASQIVDYASTGGLLTFNALTTAPGNGDLFKIA